VSGENSISAGKQNPARRIRVNRFGMIFMRYKTIALIFLIGLPVCSRVSAVESDPAFFIWWSVGTGGSLPDGRFEQTLTLETLLGVAVEQPDVWLRVNAGRGGAAFWRKGEWSSSDPWTLIVQSNEYAVVNAFARAEIKGQPHFAQTRLVLYGQSKETDKNRKDSGEGPDWPEFQARSSGEFYWPQTGHEFSVSLSKEARENMEVWSGGGKLLDEMRNSGTVYTYTPPHDPALNRAGTTASKPLIFVARINEGGSASFTQIVHRSRFAGLNKKAGLTVFTAAFLLSCLTAVLSRKKVRPCC